MLTDFKALHGRWIKAFVIESSQGNGPIKVDVGPVYDTRGKATESIRTAKFEAVYLGDHAEGYVVEMIDDCEVARHNARAVHSVYWEEWTEDQRGGGNR